MKISKAGARSSAHKIPELRFEDQALTSFSGIVVLQGLFDRLDLRQRLRGCVRHLRSSGSYSPHKVLLLLTVHLMLGWKRLRDLDYYRDDPLVSRAVGFAQLPSVATVSRALGHMDEEVFERQRELIAQIALERVEQENLQTLTVDFDGSVLSTKSRRREGTAVGYNRRSKGQRSYYPLFATLAQTGQVLDVLHRAGNVHDSNGSLEFSCELFEKLRSTGFRGKLEARMDGAHFSEATCTLLAAIGVEFSISVPFERMAHLKQIVEARRRWKRLDDVWSCFELPWKPKSWHRRMRCVVYRQRVAQVRKGPLQLDLFEPVSFEYEYKAVMTSKTARPRALLEFHNGRGSQEGLFAELKTQAAMDYMPSRKLVGNKVYLGSALLAHNLARELQMETSPRSQERNTLKRAALWTFEQLDTLRKRLIQRAGRLTRPNGVLTLTMSANEATANDITRILGVLRSPA